MEHTSILELAVRVLATAAGAVLICVRLRIPSVAGLLVAGAFVGPFGLGWVTEVEAVERVAEIGVVLLLFVIGLEFSRERLRELGRFALVGGSIQVAVTALAAALLAALSGLAAGPAIFVGLVVCGSSSTLLLKVYGDRGELESLHGRAALGVSLFQDVLLVPMLVAVPLLGTGSKQIERVEVAPLLAGAAGLAGIYWLGRRPLTRLLGATAASGHREAFLLGAVALCLGMAWLSDWLGLSAALGAFLAGLLLADTEYAHQAVAEVVPLREVFASVFFVAIGMLVDISVIGAHPFEAFGIASLMIALKAVLAAVAVLALGLPRRTAILAAIGLAQVGEFSFVLLEAGRLHAVVDSEQFQLLLSASAISMLTMPMLVALVSRLAAARERHAPGAEAAAVAVSPPQVLIVGYGANGEILARILHETSIRYQIVDADADRVKKALAAGEPVHFGDATRPEILLHAGAAHVKLAVIAISDPQAVEAAVRGIRRLASQAKILVRTRRLREVGSIERAGADRVVAEEYESAIAIYTWALEELRIPRNVIEAQTRVLRGEDYKLLRGVRPPAGISQAVAEALASGTTDIFRMTADCGAIGRSLGEIDLRRRSGATVLAVVRAESPQLTPAADFVLQSGDELVLLGAHAEIEAAFELLRAG